MPVTIQEVFPAAFSSFQTAAAAALGHVSYLGYLNPALTSPILLYHGGCLLDDGTTNCTTTCLNVSLAFRNISSIQNCMVYPVISRLMATGNLTDDAASLASRYGIMAAANTSAISHILTACFSEACSQCNSGSLTCPANATPQSNWTGSLFLPTAIFGVFSNSTSGPGCFPDICSSIDSSILQDIGGIGAFIAYFMQIAIALTAWAALRFFDTWTRNIVFCLACPFGWSRSWNIATSYQKKLKGSRQCAALKTALVEFHKAQCLFMLSLQIAGLTALKSMTQLLSPKNYYELFGSITLISYISIGGIVPVTFVLFCLHSEGMKSWYAFILSMGTVFTSVVTFFSVTNFRPTLADINPLVNLNSCGGNPSPTKYCYVPSAIDEQIRDQLSVVSITKDRGFYNADLFESGSGIGQMLIFFSLVILVLLFVDQCEIFHRGGEKRVNGYVCLKMWIADWPVWSWPMWKRARPQALLKWIWLDTAERAIRSWTAVLLLTIEIYYVFCHTMFFIYLLVIFLYGDYTRSWSFGQIIAVVVWMPSVIEYGYLALRGLKNGSRYRLPKPYYVAKESDAVASPTTT